MVIILVIVTYISLRLLLVFFSGNEPEGCNQFCSYGCEQYGWNMDTTYNVDSSKFILSLHYYEELEYEVNGIDTIKIR